ncbi:hypothetical protein ACGFZQ_43365 [Streptomyces sp. NPDC048254]|uniref:hypothetical protein n=1 Tax=Streptomyces sp. NPDC048254 TaxID=3365525 RepID=UPI003715DF47
MAEQERDALQRDAVVGEQAVYWKQLRPVITEGAEAMDDIFAEDQEGKGVDDSEEGDAVA